MRNKFSNLDYKKNGFVFLPNYLSNKKEFIALKKSVYKVICHVAEKHKIKKPSFNDGSISLTCIELSKTNDKSISLINDTIHQLPELYSIYSANYMINMAKKLMQSKKISPIIHGQGIRIQVPGRDSISNLPWHQDANYSKFYCPKK